MGISDDFGQGSLNPIGFKIGLEIMVRAGDVLEFRGLGFSGLGFGGLGFRVFGFRASLGV